MRTGRASDRSLMVDPLRYYLYQLAVTNGMYYPVCGMVHIKNPLLLNEKPNPDSALTMSSAIGLVGIGFASR